MGFEKWQQSNPKSFVFFYAPRCGHCRAASPDFSRAASLAREKGLPPFAAVDCTSEERACGDHSWEGFPTFKYFGDSSWNTGEEFNAPRTDDFFIEFVTQLSK